MLGLDQAVKDNKSLPVIEALLQFAESAAANRTDSNPSFTAGKKGHAIPSIDYVFGQTVRPDVWHLFLGRVSQRARDNALAGTLQSEFQDIVKIRALLEWGANPELCQDRILEMLSSPDSEEVAETLLLSPLLGNSEFLNQALIQSISSRSLRTSSMLLFRGANPNFNHGDAMRKAVSTQSYYTALAIMLLSKQAVSSSILDDAVGHIGSWHPDFQKPYLLILLYGGASGPRTSRAVMPYIMDGDNDIVPVLADSFAFGHGSFPVSKLFQFAVEVREMTLAMKILQSGRRRSFLDYASTGVHLQLVESYRASPDESMAIISELLALGVTGDYTSQMLVKCCEAEQIELPEILILMDFLVQSGGAKATYADGRCLLLAIEASKPAIVKVLILAQPTRKILNAAFAHANSHMYDGNPSKLEIYSLLLHAGASGQIIDDEFVKAIDRTPQALEKVKALLPFVSLDHADGKAIFKAIELERLDILEVCIENKSLQTCMPSVWKQTRHLFNIAGNPLYSLPYMQLAFNKLHRAGRDAACLDDLLHDATRCQSKDMALNLSSQFVRWGASPDHALGAPLVACVKRSDVKTLGTLLSLQISKTSLKYAFEEAVLLPAVDRYEILKMLVAAGLERAWLDAALPGILRADNYDSSVANLLVANGAKLHSSFGEDLAHPAKALDLPVVEALIPTNGRSDYGLLPLKAVLSSRSDWQESDGPSLPIVKLLLRHLNKGTWADRIFVTQVKMFNRHSTNLFIEHLTTRQVLSDALRELLSDDANFSPEKLSMTKYLLEHGAEGDIIDRTYILAAENLEYEWIVDLSSRLSSPTTQLSAFKKLTRNQKSGVSINGRRLEIVQFLLKQGLQAPAVDEVFVQFAAIGDVKGLHDFVPYISAQKTFSEALRALNTNSEFALTDAGRFAVESLVKNGASGAPVMDYARMVARAHSQLGVELIVATSKNNGPCQAAFRGLMEERDPLESPESRAILRYLLSRGLNDEDAREIASVAASKYDIALMTDIRAIGDSKELCNVALTALAAKGGQWLCTAGLLFLEYLLRNGARGPTILKMVETAARALHLPALRLLQDVCDDKELAANIIFAAVISEDEGKSSPERLAVMELALEQGATGAAVRNTAARAARTSNYDALEVFLKSPAVTSIIPVAFKAVTREESKHLSSEQLSIASILIKQGVPTDILAIAAVETAKLLDLEALKVLSQSSRFTRVTDETLRALLQDESLWRRPEGLRIMQFLFEIGVSSKSTETAASKVAAARDRDALRVVLDSTTNSHAVEVAFTSLTTAGGDWLSPEGLWIADLLIGMGPSQASVDKAFIQASRYLNHDAVRLLHPHITEVSVFNIALAEATSTGIDWVSKLQLIEQLLNSCADGEVIDSALLKSAHAQNYDCLELLSARVDRWEVYTRALTALRSTSNWRQCVRIIEFILDHGALGKPVEEAYIAAAMDLDYRVTLLLGRNVDNADVECQAFSVATQGSSWLLPGHMNLLEYLYHRGITSSVVQPALNAAAKALNVPAVALLAENANEKMSSTAFASAISDGNDWTSANGLSILKILLQKGARGEAVAKAMIGSAMKERFDLIELFHPNVDNEESHAFSAALDALITTGDLWLSNSDALDAIQTLVGKGAVADSAPKALILAAQNGNIDAVNILSQIIDDPVVYIQAFNALTQSGSLWLQHDLHGLLTQLLSRGSPDVGLHMSLITATQEVLLGAASIDLLVLLLEYGADVNYGDGKALQLVVKHSRLDLIELFLKYGPRPGTLYMGLQEAICNGHPEQVVLDLLRSITRNDSINLRLEINHDSDLGSPLIFYCLKHYPSSCNLAKEIIDLSADLNATIKWSVYQDEPTFSMPEAERIPPLLFAIHNQVSDKVIADVLCNYGGADHNHVPSMSRASALVLAARMDRSSVLSTLLDLGAKIAQQDCFGRTAIFYAGRNGNISSLTSLLKKNPPPNDGSLHEAARELHPEAVKTLVAAGHDINFPSLKHGGRTALCELCYGCDGSKDQVALQSTLQECVTAKAAPLRKCRGKTAIFYAIENIDPVEIVPKLIDVCLWRDLNDPSNVFEQDSHFYSPTMYIKKGICHQPEKVALQVWEILRDASAEDRYYARERMQQPKGATGMPQRIADLDHKKWIRSSRLEEEQEDHQQRMRRELEEMNQRNQLSSSRHLQTMEQREDLAQQTILHNADAHWQSMQFRSLQHDQMMRSKDEQFDHQLDEVAALHRLRYKLDNQVRSAQLEHDSQAAEQKLGYLGDEQGLRLDGAQAQQQLRLGGITAENTLKSEQETRNLMFKAARSTMDREDLETQLQYTLNVNADKVFTNDRLEDIARESQQRKNELDERGRQAQLEYLEASDEQKLQTEANMNQHRQENNQNTMATRLMLNEMDEEAVNNKHTILENDRRNQIRFNATTNHQKLDTLRNQGIIQNEILLESGRIETQNLSDRNELMEENRNYELEHTRDMGYQQFLNEREMGQARIANEASIGQQRNYNEQLLGQQRYHTQQAANAQHRGRLMDNYMAGQASNNQNRQRLMDGYRAQAAGTRLNQMRRGNNLQAQQMGANINHMRHADDLQYRNAQNYLR